MKINKPLKFQKEAAIRPTTDNYLIFNFYSLLRITTYLYFIYIDSYEFHCLNILSPILRYFQSSTDLTIATKGDSATTSLEEEKHFDQGRWRMEEWLGGNDHGEWSITYDLHAEINRANRGWSQELEEWTLAQTASVGIREWFWFPRHFHARSFPSLAAYRQKTSPRLAFFFSSINRENHSIPPSVFIYP